MAVLYVTEFDELGKGEPGLAQIAKQPPIAEQTVAVGGASTPSATFNASTRFVRLHTDVICSFEFGSTPTATTSDARMAADNTEYFGVLPGQKVAVISNT